MREYWSIGKGYLDLFVWENDNQNPPPFSTNAAQAMVPTLSTPIECRTQSLLEVITIGLLCIYCLSFLTAICVFKEVRPFFWISRGSEFIEDQAAAHTRGSVFTLSTKSFLKTCI